MFHWLFYPSQVKLTELGPLYLDSSLVHKLFFTGKLCFFRKEIHHHNVSSILQKRNSSSQCFIYPSQVKLTELGPLYLDSSLVHKLFFTGKLCFFRKEIHHHNVSSILQKRNSSSQCFIYPSQVKLTELGPPVPRLFPPRPQSMAILRISITRFS